MLLVCSGDGLNGVYRLYWSALENPYVYDEHL